MKITDGGTATTGMGTKTMTSNGCNITVTSLPGLTINIKGSFSATQSASSVPAAHDTGDTQRLVILRVKAGNHSNPLLCTTSTLEDQDAGDLRIGRSDPITVFQAKVSEVAPAQGIQASNVTSGEWFSAVPLEVSMSLSPSWKMTVSSNSAMCAFDRVGWATPG